MKSDESFSRFAYLTHEDLDFLQDPDFYHDHDMTNSYQQSEDYDENVDQHIYQSLPAGIDDPAAVPGGNDGVFNNDKNEASKSVNGNDFDKIIDIPAVVNNETSKEESKGGD